MLRWILFALAFVVAVIGSLTVIKSPDWSQWRLAVLAGEFGHWVAFSLTIAAIAWWARGPERVPTIATLFVCALGAGLLLKPSVEAWILARTLPDKLATFGRTEKMPRVPFSIGEFFGSDPAPVTVQTFTFSGDLALDFYPAARPAGIPRREGESQAAPCVVVVHGGGWDNGDRTQLGTFNHWLARRGYAVAAISYRLAPKSIWPAQREDVLAAIAFVKSRATDLAIDPTRLVLLGRSAGGQIAQAVAFTANEHALRGVIALYAPADMHFAWTFARADDVLKSPVLLKQFLGGTPETARAAYDGASGYLHVTKGTVPTLLIHGQLDTLVWHRQSERLAERLAENGVRHAFVSLPWATHAFEYNLHGPGGQITTYAVESFLAAVMK